jgi:hypothetical protein
MKVMTIRDEQRAIRRNASPVIQNSRTIQT